MQKNFSIGILGAGLGTRMQATSKAKPLAMLNGTPLLERLTGQLQKQHPKQILCALREELLTAEDKKSLPQQEHLSYLFVNTESSLHTLYELIRALPEENTLFIMADTILRDADMATFVSSCKESLKKKECLLLITPHVDDEKPLWVDVDSDGYITKIGAEKGTYVTSGAYFLTKEAQSLSSRCIDQGMEKMRNFLSHLLSQGIRIKSFVVEKTIDVDHPSDLEKAAKMLLYSH